MSVKEYSDWTSEQLMLQYLGPFRRKLLQTLHAPHVRTVDYLLMTACLLWLVLEFGSDAGPSIGFFALVVLMAVNMALIVILMTAFNDYDAAYGARMKDESEAGYEHYCEYLDQLPEERWPATVVKLRGGPTLEDLARSARYSRLSLWLGRGFRRVWLILGGIVLGAVPFFVAMSQRTSANLSVELLCVIAGLLVLVTGLVLEGPCDESPQIIEVRERFELYLEWEQRYATERMLPLNFS